MKLPIILAVILLFSACSILSLWTGNLKESTTTLSSKAIGLTPALLKIAKAGDLFTLSGACSITFFQLSVR
jgi:hypothetical protein